MAREEDRERREVASLVQLCSDRLLDRVVPPRSWVEVGNEFSLSVFCETEILVEVEKHLFGQIPVTLAAAMLEDAMARYDSQLGIQKLLIIFLCLVENIGRCVKLRTPLYLYHWYHGRILILERLLESGVLETVRELSLDMYNFYHRQGLGVSWARNIDPHTELER